MWGNRSPLNNGPEVSILGDGRRKELSWGADHDMKGTQLKVLPLSLADLVPDSQIPQN